MKMKTYNLAQEVVGEVSLNEDLFGLELRPDLIKRVIDWQLAKARSGCHKTKTVSEVSGTTRKPFKQKGTGNARQGSLRSVHMRGGGVAHGPVFRSHAFSLPKKVRKLALRHALSAKLANHKLLILEDIAMPVAKTNLLAQSLAKFGIKSCFIVDGQEVSNDFVRIARNIPNVVTVPQIGANVYDIIKYEYLILTRAGLESLEMRLGNA